MTFIPLDANLRPFGILLPWEGRRIPTPRLRHFERKRDIFFVRDKAKDVRIAASGKHPAPCAPPKTVFHADHSTQEKEHGKRKRSLGCARDDDTRMPLPSKAM